MRCAVLWALLAVLAAAPALGSGYEGRQRELEKYFELNAPRMSEAERAAIKSALGTYYFARTVAFDRLVRLIGEASPEKRDQEREWVDAVRTARGQLKDSPGGSLDSLRDQSVTALVLRDLHMVAEDRFWSSLETVKVAAARDRIVELRRQLAEKEENLELSWAKLTMADDALDEQAKKVIEDCKQELAKAIQRAAEGRKNALEWMLKVSEWTLKAGATALKPLAAPEHAMLAKLIKDTIDQAIVPTLQAWTAAMDFVGDRKAVIRSLFESEARLFEVLTRLREETEAFVKGHGLDALKSDADGARSALEGWRSGLEGDGQKADAEAFAKDVLEQLTARAKECEAALASFGSKNQGRFYGPLSDAVREKVLERQLWEDGVTSLVHLDQETQIEQWTAALRSSFGIESFPTSPTNREEIKSYFNEQIRGVVEGWEQSNSKLSDASLREMFDRAKLASSLR